MSFTIHFENNNYRIMDVACPLNDEDRVQYGVQNKKTKVVEVFVDTMDNALIAAETLDYILDNVTWRAHVEDNIRRINKGRTPDYALDNNEDANEKLN